ncbi:MAG: MarC family protein [Victivallales bacterium]|nr:MarC family protein [Victivallales bacterium]
MFESLLEALAVFFVVIGPVDNCAAFASFTKNHAPRERRRMALKAILVSSGVLFAFAFLGDDVLGKMGVSLSSLEIAGGILLLLLSIQMVMGKDSRPVETEGNVDVSVFPMAMPLIAGPDAIVAVVLLVSRAKPSLALEGGVMAVLALVLLITYLAMLGAAWISRLIGRQGLDIASRLLGILLTALAVEFIVDGLAKSTLFVKGG